MSYDAIIKDWKSKAFHPIYWLEGEEDYFIDQLVNFAEKNILTEAEAEFNLIVFYGRDAQWPEVINACRRYPMFAEKQVVILKEAQQMRELQKLEPYFEKPLSSTIFIVAHKQGKIDGRTAFGRKIKEKASYFLSSKVQEKNLAEWVHNYISSKKLVASGKVISMLVNNIGNDLSRISNEIDKLALNLGERKEVTDDDIEKFIGISKDYNVFEFQKALLTKNMAKAIEIAQYFESNPKAAPLQLILPTLYAAFSKAYVVACTPRADSKSLAEMLGMRNAYGLSDYTQASELYKEYGISKALLLLHEYNLRSIGVKDSGTSSGSLLKEFVFKLIN